MLMPDFSQHHTVLILNLDKKTGDWNPRTLKSNLLTLLHQVVENNLLPVSQGHISDGHPHAIPFLSWEALKEFHSNFYHPRNAIIYAYGNLDVDNYFQHLDSDCLGKFTVQDPPPKVVFEPKWTEPRSICRCDTQGICRFTRLRPNE
uniref:Peptidase_M16_C domain-containing protein n=1 Tax=Mesocestoides corti TaxID=53468 RepID=A0A5K3FKN7_MESCO